MKRDAEAGRRKFENEMISRSSEVCPTQPFW